MLFMLIVKASKNSESGNRPNEILNRAMRQYNEALENAGVRVMAKGLYPSSNGLRIAYPVEGGEPIITEGPFKDEMNLVAGFILIDVACKEDAVKWALAMPDPQGFGEGQIELRQVFE